MRRVGVFLAFFVMTTAAYAQLPNKVKRRAGVWEYKLQSGYEILEVKGDELQGVGYRVNQKTSDTSRVENIRIRRVNKTMVCSMTTYNMVKDSVVATTHELISSGRKLKFQNISAPTPYAIKYSMGFFNRNRLYIRVYHGPETKPVKLILTRKKEA